MVFGFFSRTKPDQAAVPKAEDLLETHSPVLDTPSPTLSEADAPPQSPELQPLDSENLKKRTRSLSPDKIHRLDHSSNESQPLVAPLSLTLSPEELLSLIKLVPPQTLYEYVLLHLPTATESEATTLAAFFKQLTPPPRFHCARCHKEYTEVENTDRSCHVAHDDESAIVEHVGSTKRHTYETLWGCCNRTVEGDGDQGPPDGWCYEGKHTSDRKRARFRADSTVQNDKLISCRRMRCFTSKEERETGAVRGRREGAGKKSYHEEEDEEEEDVDVEKLAREAAREAHELNHEGSMKKPRSVKHQKQKSDSGKSVVKEVAIEVEEDMRSATGSISSVLTKSSQSKAKARSKKLKTQVKQKAMEISYTQMEGVEHLEQARIGVEQNPKPKKGRPRKSASSKFDEGRFVPSKYEEESSGDEEVEKPKRKKRKST